MRRDVGRQAPPWRRRIITAKIRRAMMPRKQPARSKSENCKPAKLWHDHLRIVDDIKGHSGWHCWAAQGFHGLRQETSVARAARRPSPHHDAHAFHTATETSPLPLGDRQMIA